MRKNKELKQRKLLKVVFSTLCIAAICLTIAVIAVNTNHNNHSPTDNGEEELTETTSPEELIASYQSRIDQTTDTTELSNLYEERALMLFSIMQEDNYSGDYWDRIIDDLEKAYNLNPNDDILKLKESMKNMSGQTTITNTSSYPTTGGIRTNDD